MVGRLAMCRLISGVLLALPSVLSCGSPAPPDGGEVALESPSIVRTQAGAFETATVVVTAGPSLDQSPVTTASTEPTQTSIRQPPGIPAGHGFTPLDCSTDPGRESTGPNPLQWMPDGSKLIVHDGPLVRMIDIDGEKIETIVNANERNWHMYWGVASDISPDGSQIVFTSCNYSTDYEIEIVDIAGHYRRRLTDNTGRDHYPTWSPDGDRIAYVSYGEGRLRPADTIYSIDTDGSDLRVILEAAYRMSMPVDYSPLSWSPTGEHMAVVLHEDPPGQPVTYPVVYTLRADGAGEIQRVSETIGPPAWSPDGKRLALARSGDHGADLVTIRFDGTGVRVVNRVKGWETLDLPLQVWWSPDGSHLAYYCSGICVVDMEGKQVGQTTYQFISIVDIEDFVAGRMHPSLKRADLYSYPVYGTTMAWSPDGSRITVFTGDQAHVSKFPAIYTLNRDGTDPVVLARGGKTLVAQTPDWEDIKAGIASCSAGRVVPVPDVNIYLVRNCKTLVKIRDELTGEGTFLNWGPTVPLAEWEGVTVGGTPLRVTGLELESCYPSTHSLGGKIPETLAELRALEVLDLQCNNLRGPIPRQLWYLTGLRILDFGGNGRLSGSIPSEVGYLTGLSVLGLDDTDLTGLIPPELQNLKVLRELRLSNNWLIGHIPPGLGSLPFLEVLDLSHNNLTGSTPPELGQLNNLKSLRLNHNDRLSCEVPTELQNHPNAGSFRFPCDP